MILNLISIGLVSILAQVVILRELSVAFFGVELIYILAIAVWLLWTAAGTLAGRRLPGRSAAGIAGLFAALALLIPADVALIRAMRVLSGGVPGAYLPLAVQLLDLAAALLPVGIVLGVLFQWAATEFVGGTRTLAGAYALESAGGLLGGLSATILLSLGLQNFSIGLVCSGIAAAVALAGRFLERPPGDGKLKLPVLAAGLIVMLLGVASPAVDRALTRINHASLVASRDSPYGRVTITRREDQFVVFENDVLSFETQSVAAEEFVHLAASSADTLRSVLILGGGVEGTVHEVCKYSPERVELVEINAVLFSLVEDHLPPAMSASCRTSSIAVIGTDPRRFVMEASATYDLILIGAPDPTSGESNRFYTREFFRRCRRLLEERGVLALRVRSSENVWTPSLATRNASIVRALEDAFGDVVVLPGVTNIVLASGAPLERDPRVPARRLTDRGVETRLVTPEYLEYLYTNDRFGEIARVLAEADIPANTDSRPVCYRYSGMIWLSKFFPRLIAAGGPQPGGALPMTIGGLAAAGVCAAILVVLRRRPRSQRIVLAAVAGLMGMLLEAALILHFQVTSGVLYRDLGVLLMAFMGGLAAGAGAARRIARRRQDIGFAMKKIWGAGFVAGFVALSLAFAALLHFGVSLGLPGVSLFLFAAGLLVASLFAYASLLHGDRQQTLITPLYAADILGGCAASVLGSIFLIPFFGLEFTAGTTAVLALLALLAL